MSAITAKARRKMKKYAVLTREPRCFLGSFDFSWEQRKFGEVFDCTVPNNTLSRVELSYDEGTVLNVHYGDVLIKYGSVLDVQKDDIPRIPHRCIEDFNGALLQDGDVIIADTAEDETTGKACEIGNLQGSAIVSGLHTMVCRPRNRMALGYLGYYLNSNAYHHQLLPLMQGIKVLSLSRSNIQKTTVSYPSAMKEQQLIASYFSQLDHLITLHQRKCVFLFSFFRACISMNFTASTFSWEQRKLGELVDRVVRKNTNNESTLPLTISAQYGLVDQITYFNNRVASRDVSNYYLVLNGEFAYNKSTSDGYPFGAVKRLDLYEKGVLSTLYIVFTPKKEQQIDSDFLTVFFDTDRWHKGVAERAAEGARNHGLLNISAEDFFDIDLSVPKDIVEQKQIGAFIRQLDHLITLHQRECISFTGSAGRLILTANKKRTASSWEQRKLGDISEIKTGPFGSTLHADDYVSDGTPIITTEHFKTGALPRSKNGLPQVSDSDYKRLTAYTLDDGDIVFSRVGSVDINALITPFQSNWLFSGRVLRVRPQTDISSKFLHTRLETESIKTDIRTRAVGQTMPSINTEILKITPLVLPSSAAEQEQIGSYFAALDNLITLHQRKPFLMKWRTSDANRNQTNRLVL